MIAKGHVFFPLVVFLSASRKQMTQGVAGFHDARFNSLIP